MTRERIIGPLVLPFFVCIAVLGCGARTPLDGGGAVRALDAATAAPDVQGGTDLGREGRDLGRDLSVTKDVAGNCNALSQVDCQQAPGCRADFCTSCDCTACSSTFSSCSDATTSPPVCGGGRPPGCRCIGLDEVTCADQGAAGCSAVRCPTDCQGNTGYLGCAGPGSPMITCPPLACSSGCRDVGDCHVKNAPPTVCVPPGGSVGCGGPLFCPTPPCSDDSQCAALGPNMICILPACSCASGGCQGCGPGITGMSCVQGCGSTADCPGDQECTPSHRCVPKSCTDSSECPALFSCTMNGCTRTTCGSDADCPQNICAQNTCPEPFCVEGLCYDSLGTCEPQPI